MSGESKATELANNKKNIIAEITIEMPIYSFSSVWLKKIANITRIS